jgi:hypothetical protein
MENNGQRLAGMHIDKYYTDSINRQHAVIRYSVFSPSTYGPDYDHQQFIGNSRIPQYVLNAKGKPHQPQVDFTAAFCKLILRRADAGSVKPRNVPLVNACREYMEARCK